MCHIKTRTLGVYLLKFDEAYRIPKKSLTETIIITTNNSLIWKHILMLKCYTYYHELFQIMYGLKRPKTFPLRKRNDKNYLKNIFLCTSKCIGINVSLALSQGKFVLTSTIIRSVLVRCSIHCCPLFCVNWPTCL